jgi:hypothetical protein
MIEQITKLKERLGAKNYKKFDAEFNKKLSLFELENSLVLPPDLAEYFKLLDNTTDKLDSNLFQFYTVDQFKSVKNELANWGGIPNYNNIVNTLKECENCFVFADYMFHMFTYAIRLYPNARGVNEIYIICGDKYKIIANSFSDFLDLYFDDSIELQFT